MENISIYTDGSCIGNPGVGGWAAVIVDDGVIVDTIYGSYKETTNNRMELTACINALIKYGHKQPTIYTDSQYVKNGITDWIKNWKRNGWRTSNKKPVKNKDLWETLDTLNHNIKWEWVKAHNSNEFNELADSTANILAKKGA